MIGPHFSTPLKIHSLFQVSGMIAVILTGVWMGHYRGGFAWSSEPAIQFNWHPLLMMLGLIYLYGNGMASLRGIIELRDF